VLTVFGEQARSENNEQAAIFKELMDLDYYMICSIDKAGDPLLLPLL